MLIAFLVLCAIVGLLLYLLLPADRAREVEIGRLIFFAAFLALMLQAAAIVGFFR